MEHFVTKEQVKHILEHHGHHVVMDSAFVTGAPMTEIEAIVDVCDVVAQAAYDHGVKDNTTSTNDYLTRLSNLTDQVDELTEFNQQLRVENKDLSERLEQLRLSNAHLQGYVEELRQANQELRVENKQLCETVEYLRRTNRGLADSVVKRPIPDDDVGRAIKALRHMQKNPTRVVARNIEEDSKRAADLMEKFLLRSTNESEELEKAIETIQVALSGSFRDNMRLEVSNQHAWLTYGDLKFLVEPMESWQAVQSCVYLSGLEVDNE